MGSPSVPSPPPLPAPAPPAPTMLDPAVIAARQRNQATANLQGGRASTILTSSQGVLDSTNSGKKTALGQ